MDRLVNIIFWVAVVVIAVYFLYLDAWLWLFNEWAKVMERLP